MKPKLAVLILLAAASAVAQQSNGYVFFGPGGATAGGHTDMTLQTGGGVDAIIAKGIGVNAEISALWPRQCFRDCVVGVFSPGATYYFRRSRESTLDPFVNGGYSLMFRNGRENLFYFGGGANYWFSRKMGIRMELRDQVSTQYSTLHFWGFRLGFAFR